MEILKTHKRFVLFICLSVGILDVLLLNHCSYKNKAILLRAHFILFLEGFIALFSVLLWRTFHDAPFYIVCFVLDVQSRLSAVLLTSGGQNKRRAGVPTLSPSVKLIWKLCLLVYFFLSAFSYVTNIFLNGSEPHWFQMMTYTCLGSFIQLNTGFFIFKSLFWCGKYLNSNFNQRQKNIKKVLNSDSEEKCSSEQNTDSFQGHVIICALLYATIMSYCGLANASNIPSLIRHSISLKDLPSSLDGLSIIQVSDIHLGPTVGFSRVKQIVDIINQEEPDVVVITGDLIDGTVQQLKEAALPLKDLRPRYGAYFVSGNHEYYTGDVDEWFSLLRSYGVKVLHNTNVNIPPSSSTEDSNDFLCLAGTDDLQSEKIGYGDHSFDLTGALKSCEPRNPVILLAHQPKAAKTALDSNFRVDLVLSGHTHGGQMFPMMLGAYLLNPFYRGLYTYGPNDSQVYVSEGTQYWGIPMRIGTTMEISQFILHPSKTSSHSYL